MRVDPTPFMQSGALSNALSKSRSEALEARRVFETIIGSANQRPVPAEEPRPLTASAPREKEVVETRMTSVVEKEEETTPSPDPMQRPGRVLDIRV